MVIEEVGRERAGRRRSMLAFGAAVSVAAGAVAVWWHAWTHPDLADDGAARGDSMSLLISAYVVLTAWLGRRRRRGSLRWHEAVVGPRGVGPGLVIRRSLWRVAGAVVLLPLMTVGGTVGGAARLVAGQVWSGTFHLAAGLGSAVLTGHLAYWWIRFSGTAALTGEGVQRGTDFVEWDNILRAAPHRNGSRIDGVRIVARRRARFRSSETSFIIGGGHGTVPDEDILAAVEFFRTNPHRRAALDTPDALSVLTLAPRAPENPS